MLKLHRLSAAAAGLIVTLLASFPALAGIVSVTGTASPTNVSATAPSIVTVTWQVVRNNGTVLPNAGTVSSTSGSFLVGGIQVSTVSRTLSRIEAGTTAGNVTLVFTESVTVPLAVAYRAIKSGVPIVYQRTFSTTGTIVAPGVASLAGSASLNPSGPGSESFSVSRLDLRFEDQTRVKVLPKNSRLRAVAVLSTTGNGLIEGAWEIALSSTTQGAPVFRPLALVRQRAAFGGRVAIISPPLPTAFEGNNLVRLRIDDPTTFFDEPELQYYVTPESPLPSAQEPRLMLITAPQPGTPLTQTTRFAWQAVPGAEIYKLEIFGTPPAAGEVLAENETVTPVPLDPAPDTSRVQGLRPLTGVVLPAAITEVRLRDFSLAHLPGDRRYQWTVKAIGKEGAVLGVSPPREIYKP